MSFPVLKEYSTKFPNHAALISEFEPLFSKKYTMYNSGFGTNCPKQSWNSFTRTMWRASFLSISTPILWRSLTGTSIKLTTLRFWKSVSPMCQVLCHLHSRNRYFFLVKLWRKGSLHWGEQSYRCWTQGNLLHFKRSG